MIIVFVRHAHAEDRTFGQRDFDRALTEFGRQSILHNLLLADPSEWLQDSFVWTSEAVRTLETATLLASEFSLPLIEKDYLYNGDWRTLQKDLLAEPANSQIFIVGHNPDLSEWASQLLQTRVGFPKAAMVAMRLYSTNPLRAHFLWQIGFGEEVFEKNPYEIGITAYKEQTLNRIEIIREKFANFLDASSKAETCHRLRVSIRTVRSLLALAKSQANERESTYYRDALGEMAGQFGSLRELDVLLNYWQSVYEGPLENSALAKAVKTVRKREETRLVSYAQEDSVRLVLSDLSEWVNSWREDESTFVERITSRFHKWKERVSEVKTTGSEMAWHPLRIQYKKLRYVLAVLPGLASQSDTTVDSLEKQQDLLGEICDLQFIGKWLQYFQDTEPSETLKQEIDFFRGHISVRSKRLEDTFLAENTF